MSSSFVFVAGSESETPSAQIATDFSNARYFDETYGA
jgi:hypothetical protein